MAVNETVGYWEFRLRQPGIRAPGDHIQGTHPIRSVLHGRVAANASLALSVSWYF